jgi:hypothetical protein
VENNGQTNEQFVASEPDVVKSMRQSQYVEKKKSGKTPVPQQVLTVDAIHFDKGNGTAVDLTSVQDDFAARKLKLVDVPRDGNCLFSALSLQWYVEPGKGHVIRRKVADYIAKHREKFESFVEGNFDQFVQQLSENGVYAGNLAIAAFSRIYGVDVFVHVLGEKDILKVRANQDGEPTKNQVHIAFDPVAKHYLSIDHSQNSFKRPDINEVLQVCRDGVCVIDI